MRGWLTLAAVMGGTWVGLVAREDRPELPDDLARIPAKTTLAVSVRVSKLWGSELGRVARAAAGDDLDDPIEVLHRYLGLAPNEIERITLTFTDSRVLLVERCILIVRSTKKLDPKTLLPAILPGGKEQRMGEQAVYVTDEGAAFVAPDGKTLVRTHREVVEAMAKGRLGKPAGDVAAMARLAVEHDITLFTTFSQLTVPGFETFPFWAEWKGVPRLKAGVAWLDFGYTSKLALRPTFEDEKTAARARKLIEGGRVVAEISLSGTMEEWGSGSNAMRKVLERMAAALDEGRVEQKGKEVQAAFTLKVEKETADAVIKDWVAKMFPSANFPKHIALALFIYQDEKGAFPPAATYGKDGKPLLSWRVHLLPYLGQDKLYKQFKLDEAWDSPHNKPLIAKIPKCYVLTDRKPTAVGGTFYQAIHGKGAAFEGKEGIKYKDITDGPSNTILVAQAARDVPWTKPGDIVFDPDGKLPGIGPLALMADGSVRVLSAKIKPATLKAMITRNGGEVIPSED